MLYDDIPKTGVQRGRFKTALRRHTKRKLGKPIGFGAEETFGKVQESHFSRELKKFIAGD